MKTIYRGFLLFSFLLLSVNANELNWVNEQIEAIKPHKQGITNKIITNLENPFIFLKKKRIKTKTKNTKNSTTTKITKTYTKKLYTKIKIKKNTLKFVLEAIINNTALINKKWYKIGQKIDNYTIKEVNPNQVILLKGSKYITLSTNTQNTTLKFK